MIDARLKGLIAIELASDSKFQVGRKRDKSLASGRKLC